MKEVVLAVRQNPAQQGDADRHMKTRPQAGEVMHRLDKAATEALGSVTLKEFVDMGEPQELETKTVLLARQSKK